MNLKITSPSQLSIGGVEVSNICGTITQHSMPNSITGGLTCPCDLKWWLSMADSVDNKDLVWPLDLNGNKISNITIELSSAESMAVNLPLTIFNKVKESLIANYPTITFTVENI